VAQFVYVTSTHTQGTNTLKMVAASTAGDVIVVANAQFGGTLSTSVTDNLGNTYTNLGTNPSGNITLYAATNAVAGTATLTFSGASGGNTSYIASEYNVPLKYTIFSNFIAQINGIQTWIYQDIFKNVGTAATNTELLLIPVVYETGASDSWTISTGTVREHTAEGGGESLVLADVDTTLPGTMLATITDASSARNFFVASIHLIGFTTPGGGGGVILGDMSAGMRG
jgi:hypothetical protein